MELKKLAPWNWFKKEEDESDHAVPVKHDIKRTFAPERPYDHVMQLHRDIDRVFDHFFRGFNLPSLGVMDPFPSPEEAGILRPKIDLGAAEHEYVLTVEIPGVSEKEVSVDISGGTMTIKGEKKQEKEEKEKNYYRIERSYGSFQRVLSLPDDVDLEAIRARFKNGVLSITMPRKALPPGEVKQIEITSAD